MLYAGPIADGAAILLALISIPAILKKTLWVSLPNVFEIAICGYLYVYRRDTYQFAGNFIIGEEPHMKKSK